MLEILASSREMEMFTFFSIFAIVLGGPLGYLPYYQLRKGYREGVMESMNIVHRDPGRHGGPARWVNKGGGGSFDREKDPGGFRSAAIPYYVMMTVFWGPAILSILLWLFIGFVKIVNLFI